MLGNIFHAAKWIVDQKIAYMYVNWPECCAWRRYGRNLIKNKCNLTFQLSIVDAFLIGLISEIKQSCF